MSQVIISNLELQVFCQAVIDNYEGIDPYAQAYYQLMFDTGLRVSEVAESNRWTVIDPNNYQVLIAKNNALRLIDKNLVPDLLRPYYDSGVGSDIYTYSALNWSAGKVFPFIRPIQNVRRSICHLYRYNYCRTLFDSGKTVEEIKEIIKHYSLAVTQEYVFDTLVKVTD